MPVSEARAFEPVKEIVLSESPRRTAFLGSRCSTESPRCAHGSFSRNALFRQQWFARGAFGGAARCRYIADALREDALDEIREWKSEWAS